MCAEKIEKIYSDNEVDQVLPSSRASRHRWRTRKKNPLRHYVLGNRIYYSESHIREFLDRNERPTQESKSRIQSK